MIRRAVVHRLRRFPGWCSIMRGVAWGGGMVRQLSALQPPLMGHLPRPRQADGAHMYRKTSHDRDARSAVGSSHTYLPLPLLLSRTGTITYTRAHEQHAHTLTHNAPAVMAAACRSTAHIRPRATRRSTLHCGSATPSGATGTRPTWRRWRRPRALGRPRSCPCPPTTSR